MPQLPVRDTRLYVEDSGGSGPVVLFAHGLLYSCRMWDAQVRALQSRYRCIRYDHRGQGQSAVPLGGYDMDSVAEDAAAEAVVAETPVAAGSGAAAEAAPDVSPVSEDEDAASASSASMRSSRRSARASEDRRATATQRQRNFRSSSTTPE